MAWESRSEMRRSPLCLSKPMGEKTVQKEDKILVQMVVKFCQINLGASGKTKVNGTNAGRGHYFGEETKTYLGNIFPRACIYCG